MKLIILALSFCCISLAPTMAQNAKSTTAAKPGNIVSATNNQSFKTNFAAKLNDFKAILDKNDNAASTKAYMEMFELMHKAMAVNNEKLSKLTKPEDKEATQKKIVEEQTLYGEIKAMLNDLQGNKTQIIAKLEAYMKTI